MLGVDPVAKKFAKDRGWPTFSVMVDGRTMKPGKAKLEASGFLTPEQREKLLAVVNEILDSDPLRDSK